MIDTLITTKKMIDTLKQPSDTFELITKVDDFYNAAWEKLITMVFILGAIVGILIPIIIQWYQKRELKLSEKNLSDKIFSEMQNSILKLHQENRLEVEKVEQKLTLLTTSKISTMEGLVEDLRNNNGESAYSFLMAAKAHLTLNEPKSALRMLEEFYGQLFKMHLKEFNIVLERNDVTFNELMDILEKETDNPRVLARINEIKEIYPRIKHVTEIF